MDIFYGYQRSEADAKATGAHRIWIDTHHDRDERADMISVGMRSGDTLLLFSLRDLGGAPAADEVWRQKVEDAGGTIKIVAPPAGPPKRKAGRPRRYEPDEAEQRAHRVIWLDGNKSESARIKAISALYGSPVKRGALNHRYGWPTKPKPPYGEEPLEPKE